MPTPTVKNGTVVPTDNASVKKRGVGRRKKRKKKLQRRR